MGSDLSVVNAARVSFAKESEWKEIVVIGEAEPTKYLSERDCALIRYLAHHKHYSPFNHTFLTVRVKAPIFVARQLVKHEYMPWNEVSRRYVDSEPEFYFPEEGYRLKADNVKQGSSEDISLYGINRAKAITKLCLDEYNYRLGLGVCPEQARDCLPLNTMTEWIWSGTVKAFHKMLGLRLDPHTQAESREVAQKILPIVEEHFPISIKALLDESE
jgi:thymidylate synthase (FAD)